MTIRWKECKVPSSYRNSNGCLEIAAIGKKYGRSIAVASSRGFCILDLSIGRDEHFHSSRKKCGESPTSCVNGFECSVEGLSSGIGFNYPKWRMFSEIDETLFSVQTMCWWERSNVVNGCSEDVILCTVNYADEDSRQCYLAAWSRRR